MSTKTANSQLLSEVLGVEADWFNYVWTLAFHYGRRGETVSIDELASDITSSLVLDLRNPESGFTKAVARAKESDDPLKSLRGVLTQATKFRVKDYFKALARKEQRQRLFREDEAVMVQVIDDYSSSMLKELERMAVEAEGNKKQRLADRIRFAKRVLPHRLEGASLDDLMKRFPEAGGRERMFNVLKDMGQAVHRLGEKLGVPEFTRQRWDG